MKFAHLLNLSATFIFIYSCICLCTTANGTSINFQYCKMVHIKNIRADAINLTISALGSVAIIFALTAKRFFEIRKKTTINWVRGWCWWAWQLQLLHQHSFPLWMSTARKKEFEGVKWWGAGAGSGGREGGHG